MIDCCTHSDDWHGNAGCGFPSCPCQRRILRRKPAPAPKRTTCSECLNRLTPTGGGHEDGCTRTGFGPDRAGAMILR